MLLLPPGLRIFGKDLYSEQKNIKIKDEVYVLNCTGLRETINMSYMNDLPYNFQYLIKGNYTYFDDDLEFNEIILDIQSYTEGVYNEIDDTTEYRIAFNEMSDIPGPLVNYSMAYDKQNAYYTERGFNCTKISY